MARHKRTQHERKASSTSGNKPTASRKTAEKPNKPFWRELGIADPEHCDESLAPEVDLDLLRQLVRHQLPETTASVVYRMIESFASWSQAHGKIVAQEFRRKKGREKKGK
jgi:hypothetical protein